MDVSTEQDESLSRALSLPTGIGKQLGYPFTPFHSGSKFRGYQQSKGNKYNVEVIFQVL